MPEDMTLDQLQNELHDVLQFNGYLDHYDIQIKNGRAIG